MTAASENTAGYKMDYDVSNSTTAGYVVRGDLMADTKLNSSVYRQLQVDTNDYRTQEHPSGTAVTINQYRLLLGKI